MWLNRPGPNIVRKQSEIFYSLNTHTLNNRSPISIQHNHNIAISGHILPKVTYDMGQLAEVILYYFIASSGNCMFFNFMAQMLVVSAENKILVISLLFRLLVAKLLYNFLCPSVRQGMFSFFLTLRGSNKTSFLTLQGVLHASPTLQAPFLAVLGKNFINYRFQRIIKGHHNNFST